MVSEYIDNICRYSLSKLENVVYLVDEEAVKSINIDNGAAYISSVSQEPIAIKCYNLKLTENESLDERYKFTHTVTFSVHGYANKDNFQDRYYVIVKDMDGTYWMLNPLFPCKVGYTYNLGYQEDHTDFTLSTVSNHPVLEVKGLDLSNTFECRGYNIGGVDKLWLNEKRFTVHDGNSVKYTNDGFKGVDFKRTSGLLTETFDGDDISHSINFKIGFDDYKTSWHYNLLEFIDNIYASVIKTKGDKYTLCGFGYGLQPSYTINADDTTETPNIIDVTLTDAHSDNHTLGFYDSVDYEYLSAKTWEYTSMYGGYECVSEGMAKYLLKKETDALGNETDRYMALYGYEDRFADLNIVDTFYDEVLFSSVDCGGMACLIDLSFPSTMRFNQITCKDYHLRSDSDWSISSSESFITVSPTSGAANQDYTITVCNTIEPTATARTATLTVNYCNTVIQYDVVVEEGDSCFPQGSTYEISANAQTLTIPTKCCIDEVNETAGIGAIATVYTNYITVQVPENNSGRYRTITLLAVYCNGKSSNIIIRQSDVFESWVTEDSACFGNDLYAVERLYTGRTSGSITARTDTVRDTLIEVNSRECITPETRDITNGYLCDECEPTKYYNYYYDESGGTFVETGSCDSTTFTAADISDKTALHSSQIGTCVTSIGNDAFHICPKLDSVMLPNSLTSIGNRAFYACTAAAYITIPQSVTSIGDSAFTHCIVLASAALPNNLTSLGNYAFANCDNIATINIPRTLTRIPEGCFSGSGGLALIDLHNGIESIGNDAFNGCAGLNYVICRGLTPPTLGNNAFANCTLLESIYVPSQALDVYKAASGWNSLSNKIKPIQE